MNGWFRLKHTLAAERERLGLWLSVCFGGGIGGYFALTAEPPVWSGPLAAAIALGLALLVRADIARALALAALCAALGFTAASVRTLNVAAPILAKPLRPASLVGMITAIEPGPGGRGAVLLAPETVPGLAHGDLPRLVRLSRVQRVDQLQPGDRIRVLAALRPPPGPIQPGAFDFQRRAYFLGIGAYGFAMGGAEHLGHIAADGWGAAVGRRIAELRRTITADIHAARPESQAAAVAAALLTGHRGYIDEDTLVVLRDAGIAHLLAISGLHIGLIAGLVFVGVRLLIAAVPWLALRIDGKKAAAALAIPAAGAYALLAGLTVPTERAVMMTSLLLIGVLIDRRVLSLRTVALAALIILAARPESLIGPGFQMSFAAVTALIAGHAWLSERRQRRGVERRPGLAGQPLRYLGGVLTTTLIASAATTPFAIYHFQHASAFGLIANLIAVPLAALWVMPAGLLALMAMPLGLEGLPLTAMIAGTEAILETARVMAALPYAAADPAAPPGWTLPLIAIGGLWLCLWRTRLRLVGVVLLAIGLGGAATGRPPDLTIDSEARVAAVSTGAGGLMVSTRRAARFETDGWRRRAGAPGETPDWPDDPERPAGDLRCDAGGCTLRRAGWIIAVAMDETALDEDCRTSDLLIAKVPVRGRCRPRWGVIDRFDLWRNGAHAVYLTDTGPRIESVNGVRGRRPWVPARGSDEDQYSR